VLVLVGHSLGGALVVRTAAAVAAARTAAMRAAMPPKTQPTRVVASCEGGAGSEVAPSLAHGGLPAATPASTAVPPTSADSPVPQSSSLPSTPVPSSPAPLALNATIAAVVVMDVVEGTALAALDHMHGIIKVCCNPFASSYFMLHEICAFCFACCSRFVSWHPILYL
jgi:hypothetical protein